MTLTQDAAVCKKNKIKTQSFLNLVTYINYGMSQNTQVS